MTKLSPITPVLPRELNKQLDQTFQLLTNEYERSRKKWKFHTFLKNNLVSFK
jgi:hypothetical protein